jgi:DNA-binding beta-propeller fold protein YncE
VVDQWLVDGVAVQTSGASYQLSNVVANHTVSVTFRLPDAPPVIQYTATPSAAAHGAIAPSAVQTVTAGSNVSFSATPDSGYLVDQWFVDGVAVQTAGASYQLNNVIANHTVNVTFRQPVPKYAYVANGDGTNYSVVVCPFDTDGVTLLACANTNLNATNYPAFSYPQGITFNADASKVYVSTYTNSGGDPTAWECSVNSTDGSFSACAPYVVTSPTSYFQAYGAITLNSANTTAYIIDYYGADVLLCPIAANGSFASSICTTAGAVNLSNPVGIALNASGTTAYIANSSSNGVAVCTVNNGSFTGCTNKNGDGITTFSDIYSVALNSAGTLVYITEPYSSNVYACSTSFSSCMNVNGANTLNTPYGIVFNHAGTMAYVSSYNGPGSIYECPVNSDGTFGTCVVHNPGSIFSYPSALTLVYWESGT